MTFTQRGHRRRLGCWVAGIAAMGLVFVLGWYITGSLDWQRRWLRGIPCRLPCWEGVIPGQTSAADAVEILRKSPILSNVTMPDDKSDYRGTISWDWKEGGPSRWIFGPRGGGASYDVWAREHTITRIRIGFPLPFTLSDVIRAYGEPSHIVARRVDNIETRETGRILYDLHFVYLPYGFVLSEWNLRSKPSFSDREVFWNVDLFAPTPQGFTEATGIEPEFLTTWEGFQSYDFYCRDERTFKPCD